MKSKIIPKLNSTASRLLYLANFISTTETKLECLYHEELPIKYPKITITMAETIKINVYILIKPLFNQ